MNTLSSIRNLFIIYSLLVIAFIPFWSTNAESIVNAGVTANVVQPISGSIFINSITATRTSGFADGTFENGWKWTFDITIPTQNESQLAMRFEDWQRLGATTGTIAIANNLRFYSAQSSNAFSQNTAIYITAPNTYSNTMFLNGDLDNSSTSRRVQITAEYRIPSGTLIGGYSTNFGIRTQ